MALPLYTDLNVMSIWYMFLMPETKLTTSEHAALCLSDYSFRLHHNQASQMKDYTNNYNEANTIHLKRMSEIITTTENYFSSSIRLVDETKIKIVKIKRIK